MNNLNNAPMKDGRKRRYRVVQRGTGFFPQYQPHWWFWWIPFWLNIGEQYFYSLSEANEVIVKADARFEKDRVRAVHKYPS